LAEQSSSSNPDWQTIATTGAGVTSYNLTNLANGTYSFRIRGIHAGQIGKFVTNPGNTVSITVDARSKVDITSQVSYPVSNVSFVGGVWQQDFNLINNSTQTFVPTVDFNVIGLSSPGVRVINADNGKGGTSSSDAALFGFSQKLGSDQLFSTNEATSTRTIRFQDSAGVMFSWDVLVTAYVGTGGSSGSSSPPPAGSQSSPSGGGDAALLPLTKVKAVMRFTANPLTKTVTSQLVTLK